MATTVGVGLLRDRLSNLPDGILVTILSRLSIDKAARCSILASRWRHLFPSTLLDLRAFTMSRSQNIAKLVTTILAAHPTEPIRTFMVGELFLRPEDKSVVDGWLRDLSTRGIQDLSLSFNCFDEIPESLFACSSLKRLHLIHGTFPDATPAAASLACLTEINLFSVRISGDSLNTLLLQCTALEHLTVKCNLHSLLLRSRSLKVLNCTGADFKELFIDDAPNLERILHRYMQQRKVQIKVVHAPKLEFFGYIGMSNKMEIGDTSFVEVLIDVKTIMPSMKTLAIDLSCDQQGYIQEGYIDWLMQLLKLFPRLETLYIESSHWSGAQDAVSGSWEMHRLSVHCNLEKVVFQAYRGHKWQREMAKFLHGRSEVLKTMEFHCMNDGTREGFGKAPSEEWVREQKELLCLDSTAARDASFLFFKGQMVVNHFEFCNKEQYQRNYYCNLYFDESVLHGQR
ncbi:unnamed protein product [Alopecurus aequalis]